MFDFPPPTSTPPTRSWTIHMPNAISLGIVLFHSWQSIRKTHRVRYPVPLIFTPSLTAFFRNHNPSTPPPSPPLPMLRQVAASRLAAATRGPAALLASQRLKSALTPAAVATVIKGKKTIFDAAAVDATAKEFFDALSQTSYCHDFDATEASAHVEAVLNAKASQTLGDTFEYFHSTDNTAFFICGNEVGKRTAMLRRINDFFGHRSDLGLVVRSYVSKDGKTAVCFANYMPFGPAKLEEIGTSVFAAMPAEFRTMAQGLVERAATAVNPVQNIETKGDCITFSMVTRGDQTFLAPLTTTFEELKGALVLGSTVFSFANGYRLYTLTVKGAKVEELARLASLVPLLPHRPFNTITRLHEAGKLNCEESVFISTVVVFASYFTPTPSSDDYRHLRARMAKEPNGVNRLNNYRRALSQEMMSEHYIANLCAVYPDLVKKVYADFQKGSTPESRKALEGEILAKLKEDLRSDFDMALFSTFVKFNEVVKKHNFYKPDKAPYGVFLFTAPHWRGFHVRFTDIARGGVRMILSKGNTYNKNKRSVFQENYNLAHTQLLKNKDIPEGGSKGTILVGGSYLNTFEEAECRRLFLQYVDGMLDLIVPGEKGVVDTLQQEEIIFLGPDENTAGTFPAAGALFSKQRNYSAWKSFTTGKDPELGGIPHDVYGMTTQSVRANVEKIYEKLKLDQTKLTKFQTGGPDGDLGCNEILRSKEKVVGMVDISASLHDPNGLDRTELKRLADNRLQLKAFDKSKLSKGGFLVLVDDVNVKLSDGKTFKNGVALRDEFHFLPYSDADVFVPCGGRPRSVTLENVGRFLKVPDADGESMLLGKFGNLAPDQLKFKYIVEGANLFISQDARLALERSGVLVIKDATANKGGVTSSSLEVLAGLALSDEEHAKYMSAKSATDAPAFYKKYVKEIEKRIVDNAEKEFEAIWANWLQNPSQPKTLISDALSSKNVQIRANILKSDLFKDKRLVKYIMNEYVPKTLLEVVPIDTVLQRVPVNYQHAICAMWLASNYVYTTTLESNEFDFFRFMSNIYTKAAAAAWGLWERCNQPDTNTSQLCLRKQNQTSLFFLRYTHLVYTPGTGDAACVSVRARALPKTPVLHPMTPTGFDDDLPTRTVPWSNGVRGPTPLSTPPSNHTPLRLPPPRAGACLSIILESVACASGRFGFRIPRNRLKQPARLPSPGPSAHCTAVPSGAGRSLPAWNRVSGAALSYTIYHIYCAFPARDDDSGRDEPLFFLSVVYMFRGNSGPRPAWVVRRATGECTRAPAAGRLTRQPVFLHTCWCVRWASCMRGCRGPRLPHQPSLPMAGGTPCGRTFFFPSYFFSLFKKKKRFKTENGTLFLSVFMIPIRLLLFSIPYALYQKSPPNAPPFRLAAGGPVHGSLTAFFRNHNPSTPPPSPPMLRQVAASRLAAATRGPAALLASQRLKSALTPAAVATVIKGKKTIFDAAAVDATAKEFFDALSQTSYCHDFDATEASAHVEAVLNAKASQTLGDTFEYFHSTDNTAFFICGNEVGKRTAMLRRINDFFGHRSDLGLVVRSYVSKDGKTAVCFANYMPFLEEIGTSVFAAMPAEFRTMAQGLVERAATAVNPVQNIETKGDCITFSTGALVLGSTVFSFANGYRLYTLTVKGAKVEELARLASLVPLLPHRPFNTITRLHEAGKLNCEESVFISTVVVFASYFTPTPSSDDYRHLRARMAKEPNGVNRLNNYRRALSQEMMSEHYIANLCAVYPDLVKKVYADFQKGSTPESRKALEGGEILAKLKEDLRSDFDMALFSTFVKFNEVVKKHNFYKPDKAVLGFRLDPSFLLDLEYPRKPYGVFLFTAPHWRGFHVRFTDIARGGVRMILSKGNTYNKNKRSVFQENYNLAHTQLLKNKDIPEGGSKGTILVGGSYLNTFEEAECRRLFLQYVDGMLDLIVPGEKGVVDTLQQEEIIFLGPDENTAGTFPRRGRALLQAAQLQRDPELGGIPHDVYGMTTQSVRANVEKIYEKLKLDQTKLTKFQTGGPDGDLGCNEILRSKEKVVGMVDISASLHDPNGLDRTELKRLADNRLQLKAFDKSKLSKGGFLVLVDDVNVKLPDGKTFKNGVALRDEFHFLPYSDADVFVPCGGRPRSVTLENVGRFLKVPDADGESMLLGKFGNLAPDQLKFKYIVEGANLFISQDARLALERSGVLVIKDATANKGGVTSSSLEVLAGLALSDEEHAKYMSAKSATDAPAFYKKYVKEIEKRIVDNAEKEFEAIWANWLQNPSQPKTLISDALSSKNVQIRANILKSDLFKDKRLVKYIMNEYVPKTLLEVVPIDTVLQRVPVNYQHAICAMWLASNYVYTTTLESNEFDFFRFMSNIYTKAAAAADATNPIRIRTGDAACVSVRARALPKTPVLHPMTHTGFDDDLPTRTVPWSNGVRGPTPLSTPPSNHTPLRLPPPRAGACLSIILESVACASGRFGFRIPRNRLKQPARLPSPGPSAHCTAVPSGAGRSLPAWNRVSGAALSYTIYHIYCAFPARDDDSGRDEPLFFLSVVYMCLFSFSYSIRAQSVATLAHALPGSCAVPRESAHAHPLQGALHGSQSSFIRAGACGGPHACVVVAAHACRTSHPCRWPAARLAGELFSSRATSSLNFNLKKKRFKTENGTLFLSVFMILMRLLLFSIPFALYQKSPPNAPPFRLAAGRGRGPCARLFPPPLRSLMAYSTRTLLLSTYRFLSQPQPLHSTTIPPLPMLRQVAASRLAAATRGPAALLASQRLKSALTPAAVATVIKGKKTIFDAAAVDATAKEFFDALSQTSYCHDFDATEASAHVEAVLNAKASQTLGDTFEYFHSTDNTAFFICGNEVGKRTAMLRRINDFFGHRSDLGLVVRSYVSKDGKTAVCFANYMPFVNKDAAARGPAKLEEIGTSVFAAMPAEFRTMAQGLVERAATAVNPVQNIETKGDCITFSMGALVLGSTVFSFANGYRLYTLTVKGAKVEELARLASLVPLLPHRPFNTITRLHEAGKLNCEESVFISTVVVFASYFTPTPSSDDYRHLRARMAKEPNGVNRLNNYRRALSQEMMSEHYIANLCAVYPDLVKKVYADFQKGSTPESRKALEGGEILAKLKEDLRSDFDMALFSTFVKFNEVVKKHNFYKPDKAYPRKPYGVFLFTAPHWRGFHVRFTDIARGGVRMILSKGNTYNKNKRSVFQENYNLAHTQLLKNKDIPEGGSKGTILVGGSYLNTFEEAECRRLFLQYVDGMLDLIVPGEKGVVDTLQQEEIIFLGPDENTAGTFPAAGALFSKQRNYSAWKSFTTGKDPELGGIPHDVYGMTTQSVRANVEKIYEKLKLDQTKLTKFQTGGPDGDLGCNEILRSKEKVVGMVDISASLHDPNGLDRTELKRLADNRLQLKAFDKSKLSKGGFLVLVDDVNVKLPDGKTFKNGVALRDEFHFLPYSDADVFVPCGGRPRSVTLENVGRFLKVPDADGESMLLGKFGNLAPDQLKFKYIVEGANLFISQDARLALERSGVLVIKDATANKGGVTSSSLEVLAGLALSDEEHAKYMSAKSATDAPAFYKKYVKEIEKRIVDNAEKEFEAIWANWLQNPSQPKTLISDALSSKNVQIRANILKSDLFKDKRLVKYIMNEYVPKTLLEVVPIDTVLQRVPVNYQHAICAMWLASNYVYTTTLESNEFDFFRFMSNIYTKAAAAAWGLWERCNQPDTNTVRARALPKTPVLHPMTHTGVRTSLRHTPPQFGELHCPPRSLMTIYPTGQFPVPTPLSAYFPGVEVWLRCPLLRAYALEVELSAEQREIKSSKVADVVLECSYFLVHSSVFSSIPLLLSGGSHETEFVFVIYVLTYIFIYIDDLSNCMRCYLFDVREPSHPNLSFYAPFRLCFCLLALSLSLSFLCLFVCLSVLNTNECSPEVAPLFFSLQGKAEGK
eukprot:gene1328-772_t